MRRVPDTPQLSKPPVRQDTAALHRFAADLTRSLFLVLSELAYRVNRLLPADGSERMTAPMPLVRHTVASLPSASIHEGDVIYVSDETGGATLAFSDGTNWLRAQDRAVVS